MKLKPLHFIMAAIMLLICLTGCGKTANSIPSQESIDESDTEMTYLASFYPLTTHTGEDISWINGVCVSGNSVFYIGSYYNGMIDAVNEVTGEPIIDDITGEQIQYENYQDGIFVYNLDLDQVSLLEGYIPVEIPEGMQGNVNLNGIAPGVDGTIWVLEEVYSYYFDLPEGFDPDENEAELYNYYVQGERLRYITQYNSDGEQLHSIKLESIGDAYLDQIAVLPDGRIVGYDYQTIYIFDENGSLQTSITEDGMMGSFCALSEDSYAVVCYDDSTQSHVMKKLDLNTGKFANSGEALPANVYELYAGHGDYEYLYQINDTVFGRREDGSSDKLFSWLNCDVNSNNVRQFAFLSDGRIVALEEDHMTGEMRCNLVILEQIETADLPQKQELTLGCVGLDWEIRNRIVNFNRSNQNIRITVRDYSEFVTDGNYDVAYDAALQKLTTEVLSGSAPDILCTDYLPIQQYISKGVLIDLWPLIDSDPELSRDSLMTHFFDALSVNDKLYQVAKSFSIATAAVSSDIAAGRTSWTLDELLEARDLLNPEASIFGAYDTSDYILQSMLQYNLDQFMDWNSGTCSFDSEDFLEILRFANEFPQEQEHTTIDWDSEESEYTRLKNGKQLMMQAGIYSFDDILFHSGVLEGKASYIGFPTSGDSGSSFICSGCLAITSSCSDVDAAWSLVRTILLEENQVQEHMYQFPTNKHAFEIYKEQAMTPEYTTDPETGEQVEVSTGGIGYNDFMVELYSMKQEEFDAFWAVYENCNTVASGNNEVIDMISKNAGPYFAGQKTAEETAALIQDQISLYMMEQS